MREDWLRTQTLHERVKEGEANSGKPAGVPTAVADELEALERESDELVRPFKR